ncbi:MAG: hypothetical protein K2Z81_11545 [Cyanobacteria bacterium]|nr:hypothetical protein [Cyanobacteriota bacterium]
MGFFDFLKKKKPVERSESEQLLDDLMESLSQNNLSEFGRLCRDNIELIEESFNDWKVVPEALRNNTDEVERYGTTVVAVAEYFHNTLGRRALRQALTGSSEDNPLVQWEHAIEEAREKLGHMDFVGAEETVRAIMAKNSKLQGKSVNGYLTVSLGLLGQTLFHQGKAREALEFATRANELCATERDMEGVLAYTATLYEINRYLGDSDQAAECASYLADFMRQSSQITEAMQWRRRAELARDGEPLNRVQIQLGDRVYELEDINALRFASMDAKFLFARNRISPALCESLCQSGVALAEEGNFELALEHFRKASSIDGFDPQPHYMRGLTLLNLRRYGEAIEAYETTENLAPGWFQCRSDLWMSKQLAGGRYNHDLLDAVCQIQDGDMPTQDKIQLCQEWLDRHADLACLHLFMGKSLQSLGRNENAYQFIRQGLIVAEEPDVRTRLLVAAATVAPPGPDRDWFLESAIELNGNLVSAAMARVLKRSDY